MNNLEKIFLKNIDLCVRQYEKEIQKKKVIHGMRKAIQNGKHIGAVPFGYEFENGRLSINGDGLLLKRAYKLRAKGVSVEKIYNQLFKKIKIQTIILIG